MNQKLTIISYLIYKGNSQHLVQFWHTYLCQIIHTMALGYMSQLAINPHVIYVYIIAILLPIYILYTNL